MPETPLDKPLMTIVPAPDGYIPGKMQLHKVKGSSPSLVQPDREEGESPTNASNDFIIKNVARGALVAGVGVGAMYGSFIGEGIATGNTNRIIFGAVGAGFSLATVAFNAKVIESLRK